ncbi:MAG TPA: hypothetical protein VE684_03705 [Crenalkalicoccus sp.]|nr:hypothetical protein [Crenalkalicoccus sp.]
MQQDIAGLEAKMRRLDQGLASLGSAGHADRFAAIIRRPGFTTVAEVQLLHAMMDAMQHQVDGLHRSHEAMLAAADRVGTK